MRFITLITAPTVEPVTLAEAKLHLRVDHADEDSHIRSLIIAAREHAQNATSRAFVGQTWRLSMDCFPDVIRTPRPPLTSVTSIAYTDTAGASQTLSASAYTVDTYSEPGRIVPAFGQSWPATRDIPNAVIVTYVAGYGAGAAADVPQPIRQAILLLVGHWYANREGVLTGTISKEIEFAVSALLAPYVNRYPIDR